MCRSVPRLLCWAMLASICLALDTNPLSAYQGTDSSVFTYVGQAMIEGSCPYRDVFDHKGLLLYFLNVAGLSLGIGVVGVWLVESGLIFLSGLFTFNYLNERIGTQGALGGMLVYAALFAYVVMGGNLTESYACCLSLLSLVALCRDVDRGTMSCGGCLVHGAVATLLLLLRPNLAVMPIVVAMVYCVSAWHRRSINRFLQWTMLSGAAALVTFLPFAGYLTTNGLWADCYDAYIRFNLAYAGHHGSSHPALFVSLMVTLAGCASLLLVSHVDRRRLAVPVVFACVSVLVLAANPSRLHYYGLMLAALPMLGGYFCRLISHNKWAWRFALVLAGPLLILDLAEVAAACVSGHYLADSLRCRRLLDPIPYFRYDRGGMNKLDSLMPLIDDRRSVTVLGNMCLAYARLDARTPLRYPYQMPIAQCDRQIMCQVVRALAERRSRFVITTGSVLDEELTRALDCNYCKVRDSAPFSLYRAKDSSN